MGGSEVQDQLGLNEALSGNITNKTYSLIQT